MDVKTATVTELPDCDLCKMEGRKEPAEYDAKIPGSSWANVCQEHFDKFGCSLGTGRGQKLVLPTKQPDELIEKADNLCESCGKGCPEDSWNKDTGRYRVLQSQESVMMVTTGMVACDEA